MDITHGISINIPDLLYVWMAAATPDNPIFIAICVAIEQLGYGFGFTAYMLYLIYIAEGEHKTAHYAIGTGFMALGMMVPGMLPDGYRNISDTPTSLSGFVFVPCPVSSPH